MCRTLGKEKINRASITPHGGWARPLAQPLPLSRVKRLRTGKKAKADPEQKGQEKFPKEKNSEPRHTERTKAITYYIIDKAAEYYMNRRVRTRSKSHIQAK